MYDEVGLFTVLKYSIPKQEKDWTSTVKVLSSLVLSVVWWCWLFSAVGCLMLRLFGGVSCLVVSVVWWCQLFSGVDCLVVSVV